MNKKTKTSQANVREDAIFSDEYIPVMSICPMPLTLHVEPYGGGRGYNFPKFGDKKNIAYSDLTRIMETHSTFLEKGFFYILDERVIRKHGLLDVYKNILEKENLQKVFELGDNALELYKMANDTQKEFIHKVLIKKIRDEEYVDLNLVSKIEKLSGEKIIEKGNEARNLNEVEEEK